MSVTSGTLQQGSMNKYITVNTENAITSKTHHRVAFFFQHPSFGDV